MSNVYIDIWRSGFNDLAVFVRNDNMKIIGEEDKGLTKVWSKNKAGERGNVGTLVKLNSEEKISFENRNINPYNLVLIANHFHQKDFLNTCKMEWYWVNNMQFFAEKFHKSRIIGHLKYEKRNVPVSQSIFMLWLG